MTEIWKDVRGYEGLYQVSNYGRVKRTFKKKERFLSGRADKDGYIEVILSKNQTKKYVRLHRLVAETFILNPGNKPQVNHKDRNKQNNDASNLEWVTCSENVIHAFTTGRGVHHTPVVQYEKNGEIVGFWDSIATASRSLNINSPNIVSCCHGRIPSAGGFVWQYREVSI